jgi:hypothetical protein
LWQERLGAGESISDHARTGCPRIIPIEAEPRIISFYCQYNPLPGCSRWSFAWAERYLTDHQDIIGCSISRSSLHRYLNHHALKPHHRKYFLQICDLFFFEKMEHIIQVYGSRYKYLFCLDECTGVQALERVAPLLPAVPGHPAYHEPEYIRHGAVSVLSILHVSTGQVFSECIANHTAKTILSSLRKHVLKFKKADQLHYICDNYSSHSTEDFCRGIARLCKVSLPPVKTLARRKEWLQSADKKIVFHFLPTHGSWLNMIEIWFGILQRKAIKDSNFPSQKALRDRIVDFTDTWNSHFAHPFNWTYDGKGLHEKVIARFTRWLHLESDQLQAKFLVKQIKLMHHLVNNYRMKVDHQTWQYLENTVREKFQFITDKTENPCILNELLRSFENLVHGDEKLSQIANS